MAVIDGFFGFLGRRPYHKVFGIRRVRRMVPGSSLLLYLQSRIEYLGTRGLKEGLTTSIKVW